MSDLGSSGFADFDRVGDLFRRTLGLLHAVLATGDLPDGGGELLAGETLPHIDDMEAGFRAWLRAPGADVDELRALILQGGLGLPEPRDDAESRAALIEAMRARSGAGGQRTLEPAPRRRIVALEHARLVFALMPVAPEPTIRYPGGRRSYADIPVPRSPSELSQRIEELERKLWSVATGSRPTPSDPAYRRVYGFFDIGERLTPRGFQLA